jgi:hypothetical protein
MNWNDAVEHLILFCVLFFLVGFLLGRSLNNNTVTYEKPESFLNKQKKSAKKSNNSTISIDNTTHVTKIKTDNLEKKYDSMGNTQTTNENISESVNKLKNLKK